MNPVTIGKVFISHATADKTLAEALSDLIEAGIGLTHDQIFCTSLPGQGIPAGTDFKQHIQVELAHSAAVIALLTPNYYASAFCLCELGGTWVLSKEFLPFVTPLAGFGDLKAVLKGVQALRIDQDTDLDEMRDRLLALAASPAPTPRWSVKKDKFLKGLTAILVSLPKPKIPSACDLKKVTDERDGYLVEAKSLELELSTLKLKYEELGKRKDKAAIKEVDLQFSGEKEQFEILERSTKQALKPLSKAVEEALFYCARGETWYPGQEWDGRLDDDVQRGLLTRFMSTRGTLRLGLRLKFCRRWKPSSARYLRSSVNPTKKNMRMSFRSRQRVSGSATFRLRMWGQCSGRRIP